MPGVQAPRAKKRGTLHHMNVNIDAAEALEIDRLGAMLGTRQRGTTVRVLLAAVAGRLDLLASALPVVAPDRAADPVRLERMLEVGAAGWREDDLELADRAGGRLGQIARRVLSRARRRGYRGALGENPRALEEPLELELDLDLAGEDP